MRSAGIRLIYATRAAALAGVKDLGPSAGQCRRVGSPADTSPIPNEWASSLGTKCPSLGLIDQAACKARGHLQSLQVALYRQ